jgi:hypothetical protein
MHEIWKKKKENNKINPNRELYARFSISKDLTIRVAP